MEPRLAKSYGHYSALEPEGWDDTTVGVTVVTGRTVEKQAVDRASVCQDKYHYDMCQSIKVCIISFLRCDEGFSVSIVDLLRASSGWRRESGYSVDRRNPPTLPRFWHRSQIERVRECKRSHLVVRFLKTFYGRQASTTCKKEKCPSSCSPVQYNDEGHRTVEVITVRLRLARPSTGIL